MHSSDSTELPSVGTMRRTLVAAILSLAAYQAYATSQINLSNYNTNATETLNVGPVANISVRQGR